MDADDLEQPPRLGLGQPAIQAFAEAAESGVVFAVAQGEDGEIQALQHRDLRHLLLHKGAGGIRRLAGAIGAGDDQQGAGLGELLNGQAPQRRHPDKAGGRQGIGAQPGDPLRRAGLAGKSHQDLAVPPRPWLEQGTQTHEAP
jgi:hypothetical protein